MTRKGQEGFRRPAGSCISAVNLAEALGKLAQYGQPLEAVAYQIDRLRIPVIPFDEEQSRIAASFWMSTRHLGLSLGDRACLALAKKSSLPAMTTEGIWEKAGTGARLVRIREGIRV